MSLKNQFFKRKIVIDFLWQFCNREIVNVKAQSAFLFYFTLSSDIRQTINELIYIIVINKHCPIKFINKYRMIQALID